MASNRLFLLTSLILVLTFNMFAQKPLVTYHGEGRKKIVTVELGDSMAIIEYCHANISGTWVTNLDTLKLFDHKYKGKFCEIAIYEGKHTFKPGNIFLSPGPGKQDLSFNQYRNLGYSYFLDKTLKKTLTWTGADLSEFKSNKWNQGSLVSLNPERFKQLANTAYDSLCAYYTSALYSQKFSKLVIKDYRLIPKKYMATTDYTKIFKIWQLLSKTSAKDRNIFPYLIQYPIPVAAVSIIDFEVAILASPVTYPALIGTEILIGNRIFARSTFKVIFYENGKRQNVLKIRRSRIIGSNYIYELSTDFKQSLSEL